MVSKEGRHSHGQEEGRREGGGCELGLCKGSTGEGREVNWVCVRGAKRRKNECQDSHLRVNEPSPPDAPDPPENEPRRHELKHSHDLAGGERNSMWSSGRNHRRRLVSLESCDDRSNAGEENVQDEAKKAEGLGVDLGNILLPERTVSACSHPRSPSPEGLLMLAVRDLQATSAALPSPAGSM
eukprot:766628-Hanusia_phi.AAC.3